MDHQAGVLQPGHFRQGTDDPPQQIFLFENHDEALAVWRRARVANRVLIHVDPHHDMAWLPPGGDVTFANYICPALQEGLVRSVYWVVPDGSWTSARNRQQVLQQLKRILKAYPGSTTEYSMRRDRARATVLGKPFEICSLGSLPEFREPVLLDLDVDFLMYPRVCYSRIEECTPLPCCWPEELLERLRGQKLSWDIATIAYSVEGNYTPLRWKYLGVELALRLGPAGDAAAGLCLHAAACLRAGAEAAHRGELDLAESKYHEAADAWPSSAAPWLQLALLLQERGDIAGARDMYNRMLACDPSYHTIYNSLGLMHYWRARYAAAEIEFRRTLELSPGDPPSLVGLAWLAIRGNRWEEAESYIRQALKSQVPGCRPLDLDCYRALGKVIEHQGRITEAIVALERSQLLAQQGRQTHERPMAIYSGGAPRFMDFNHFQIYFRLGRLYQKKGDLVAARQRFQMALAGGYDSPELRWQMARLAPGLLGEQGKATQVRHYGRELLRSRANFLRPVRRATSMTYQTWLAWWGGRRF